MDFLQSMIDQGKEGRELKVAPSPGAQGRQLTSASKEKRSIFKTAEEKLNLQLHHFI